LKTRIFLLTTLCVIIIPLVSGCGLSNESANQFKNFLYASCHNNLNFELANFNNGLGLIAECTGKEINQINLVRLHSLIEMFTKTNNLFVLRALKNNENITGDIRNELISTELIPYLKYVFETIDALKEINEGISGLSRESAQTALPRKQKELVQAFYIDLVDLKELYRHLSHDLTRADLTKRSIEELEEVHLINQHIINIAQQLQ